MGCSSWAVARSQLLGDSNSQPAINMQDDGAWLAPIQWFFPESVNA